MLNRVLCPIDFSDGSTHAIEQATAIAEWYKARLTILHVYHPMFVPVPGLPPPGNRVPEVELERVRCQVAACAQPALAAGTAVEVLVEVGRPASVILERAASLPADLIVMGTHGASGFEHLVLGSVTEKVLRRATCPVLTVPPRAHAAARFPFTRVLCAVDFSAWSTAALELASSLAQESGATLDVLHVIEWPWGEPPPPDLAELAPEQASALAEFRRYLEKGATNRLESLIAETVGPRCVGTAQILHGKPYVEVLRLAANIGADLIVLGVRGRNPVDLTLFGSTTNQIVRHASCSVLTLRR